MRRCRLPVHRRVDAARRRSPRPWSRSPSSALGLLAVGDLLEPEPRRPPRRSPQVPPATAHRPGLDAYYAQQLDVGRRARAASAPTCGCRSTTPSPTATPSTVARARVPAADRVAADRVARRQPRRARRVGRGLRAGRRHHRRDGRCAGASTSSASTRAASGGRRPSTASATAELDDFLGFDPTPDDAGRGAGVRRQTPQASPQGAAKNAGPLLGTCRPSTRPRTWTCCARRSARSSSTTSASPTAPTSARRMPTCSPSASAASSSTGSWRPTSPRRRSTSARPRASRPRPAPGRSSASTRATARSAPRSTRACRGSATSSPGSTTQPLPATGDPAVAQLTEGWASIGIAAAMYDQGMWRRLAEALRDARRRQRRRAHGPRQHLRRPPARGRLQRQHHGGHLRGQLPRQARDGPDVEDARGCGGGAEVEAPTWGPFLVWCLADRAASWPVETERSSEPPQKVIAEGAPPIVVVGTTRDPATPYEWSERLARPARARRRSSPTTVTGTRHTRGQRLRRQADRRVLRQGHGAAGRPALLTRPTRAGPSGHAVGMPSARRPCLWGLGRSVSGWVLHVRRAGPGAAARVCGGRFRDGRGLFVYSFGVLDPRVGTTPL